MLKKDLSGFYLFFFNFLLLTFQNRLPPPLPISTFQSPWDWESIKASESVNFHLLIFFKIFISSTVIKLHNVILSLNQFWDVNANRNNSGI